MRVDQPEVAALVHGYLEDFSLERLTRYLNALGQDVEIVVRPALAEGHLRVRTAS
jgi:predicted XRE-type DNA-binding protein